MANSVSINQAFSAIKEWVRSIDTTEADVSATSKASSVAREMYIDERRNTLTVASLLNADTDKDLSFSESEMVRAKLFAWLALAELNTLCSLPASNKGYHPFFGCLRSFSDRHKP